MRLVEFLGNTKIRNAHVTYSGYSMYVRRAHHMIDGKIVQTFDIGSIGTFKPGRGKLKVALKKIETLLGEYGHKVLYIENVLEDWFAEKLEEYGYKMADVVSIGPSCMYKELEAA